MYTWNGSEHYLSVPRFDDGMVNTFWHGKFLIRSHFPSVSHKQTKVQMKLLSVLFIHLKTQTVTIFIYHLPTLEYFIVWCTSVYTTASLRTMPLMCDNKINFRIKIWKIMGSFSMFLCVQCAMPFAYGWHNTIVCSSHKRTDRIDLFWINSFSCHRTTPVNVCRAHSIKTGK